MQIKVTPIDSFHKTIRSKIKNNLTESFKFANLEKKLKKTTLAESLPPHKVLSLLTNWLSKEDLIEIAKLEESYKKTIKGWLIVLKELIFDRYTHNFIALGIDFENKKGINTSTIDRENQDSLKQDFLKLFAINNAVPTNSRRTTKVPLSYWFNTDLGLQKSFRKPNLYVHPEDRAIIAFGGYLKEDIKTIENYQNEFKNHNNQELLEEKINTLEKLIKAQKGNKIYFEGSFHKKELIKMKDLACKYRALNNIQESRGIFSKKIESLLFAPDIPTSIKKGDYIGGLGYVVNQINVDNEDFTIIFSETNKTYTFNLYKTNEIDKKNKISEHIPKEISVENINKLNKIAKRIISNDSEIISQISFQVLDKNNIKKFKIKEANKDSTLKEILQNEDSYFYIKNFINKYPKKYDKAAKIIGIQLLKFLKDRNCTPLFLTADPYNGSTHSPVSMYLRAGFKPISHTIEELKEKMSKNMNRYPDNEKVDFYLNSFDENNQLIETLAKIYGLE